VINLNELSNQNVTCLLSIKGNHWVWHKKLGHDSLKLISKLQKQDLIRGLPRVSYNDDLLCEECHKGKYIKTSFSSKKIVSTSRPLELLDIDLFGPTRTIFVNGKKYGLVVMDNYSRWTWVMFLAHKDESFEVLLKFCKRIQNENEHALLQLEVIMVESLKMKVFIYSMKKMEFFIIFILLKYLNKMVWLKERIEHCKKWLYHAQ